MKRKAPTTLSPQTRPVPRFRPRPLAMAVALALAAGPAGAATITADGTNCTLADAITAANTDTVTGGCTAGQGDDIIELTADITLTVVDNETDGPNGLPSVASTITVNGQGHTIARSAAEGTPDFRLLHVATSGNLTLNQVTLQNGQARVCIPRGPYDYYDYCLRPQSSGGALRNLGTATLTHSTVSGNFAAISGGGFSNEGTLTLTHSTVSGNSGGYYGSGGGLSNEGMLTLTHSTVSGNFANRSGGGLSNSGDATLTHSTVSGNTASGFYGGSGGGLSNGGTLTLTHSTVSDNVASSHFGGNGGGLRNSGTATLTHSTVSGNSGDVGGGLSNSGTATLTHSTVSGNSAGFYGGGLSTGGTLTLTNSTVSGNSAGHGFGHGGGLSNFGDATLTHSTVSGNSTYGYYGYGGSGGGLSNRGTATLINTLIANSLGGGDCANNIFGVYGTVTPLGVNLIEDGSCGASAFPAGTDPQLGPLANNGGPTQTHALLPGSLAIDAIAPGVGGCGTDITTDQRGVSRPQPAGGPCDIGAFELGQAPPPGIAPILDFFDQAVSNGELRGAGPGKSARHRLSALRNMLVTAGDAIAQDKLKAACGQLAAARQHIDTDGVLRPHEFATGSAAPTLAQMLQDLRAQLGCT